MYVNKQMLDDMVRLMAEDRRKLVAPKTETEPDLPEVPPLPEAYTGGSCSAKQPFGDYPVTPQAATIVLIKQMGHYGLCAATDFKLDYTQVERLQRGHKVHVADIERVMKVWQAEQDKKQNA
jgi:hypothetical protein